MTRVKKSLRHSNTDVEYENVPEDAGFHPTCYRHFNEKMHLRNGPNGWMEFKMHTGASVCHRTTLVCQAQQVTLFEKTLRSKTGLPIVSAGPVLPALCIICKKTDKYITVGGKCQKNHLSQAETFSAGNHTHTHTQYI